MEIEILLCAAYTKGFCCLPTNIFLWQLDYQTEILRSNHNPHFHINHSHNPHPSQPLFFAQPSIIKSCISPLHLDRGKNRKFLPELFNEQYSAWVTCLTIFNSPLGDFRWNFQWLWNWKEKTSFAHESIMCVCIMCILLCYESIVCVFFSGLYKIIMCVRQIPRVHESFRSWLDQEINSADYFLNIKYFAYNSHIKQ